LPRNIKKLKGVLKSLSKVTTIKAPIVVWAILAPIKHTIGMVREAIVGNNTVVNNATQKSKLRLFENTARKNAGQFFS